MGENEVVVVVVRRNGAIVSKTRVRGRSFGRRELLLRLAGAQAAVDEIASSPALGSPPALSANEASLLNEVGFVEGSPPEVTELERSRIDLEIMLRESLSLQAAAAALGVSPSRLRQRLSSRKRTLYGIKEASGWHIPRFQFASRGKLVRGIEKVLPHIRPDAHPLAVKNWFTLPHQDLVVGQDERPVSPVVWLGAGGSAEAVALLASEV